jgi:hypothetical protein
MPKEMKRTRSHEMPGRKGIEIGPTHLPVVTPLLHTAVQGIFLRKDRITRHNHEAFTL